MQKQKAQELASQTVYRDENGKKISRSEWLAKQAKAKKVKVVNCDSNVLMGRPLKN